MKVCALQMESKPDKAYNLAQAESLIDEAVIKTSPQLVVLPEMFSYYGGTAKQRLENAESILPHADRPRTTFNFLQKLAKKYSIFIHGGSFCEVHNDHFFNTSIIFNSQGEHIATYRKIHLLELMFNDGQTFRESDFYSHGEEVTTYNCHNFTIGSAICFDLRFPALFHCLATHDSDIIALPSAFFEKTGKDHWEVLCRARAIETQNFIVAATQAGEIHCLSSTRKLWGHAMIIDPWGRILQSLPHGIGYITNQLDFSLMDNIREQLPLQKKREFYHNIYSSHLPFHHNNAKTLSSDEDL